MRGQSAGEADLRERVVHMASVYVWIECTATADTWVCVRSNANMKEADLRYV